MIGNRFVSFGGETRLPLRMRLRLLFSGRVYASATLDLGTFTNAICVLPLRPREATPALEHLFVEEDAPENDTPAVPVAGGGSVN